MEFKSNNIVSDYRLYKHLAYSRPQTVAQKLEAMIKRIELSILNQNQAKQELLDTCDKLIDACDKASNSLKGVK